MCRGSLMTTYIYVYIYVYSTGNMGLQVSKKSIFPTSFDLWPFLGNMFNILYMIYSLRMYVSIYIRSCNVTQ